MESILKNEKFRTVAKTISVIAVMFISIRYILPLILPIVIGLVISKLIAPFVNFFGKKLSFHRKMAAAITIIILAVISAFLSGYLGRTLITQITNLVRNWNGIVTQLDRQVKTICQCAEKGFNLTNGAVYTMVSSGVNSCIELGKSRMISVVMNNSVPAFIKLIEFFAAVIVMVMATWFFTTEEIKIPMFEREAKYIGEKIEFMFRAFIRAQIIIMLVTIVICFAAFTFMKNPYSLLVAILVGFMDALPLIGIGIILLPWAVVCLVAGNVKNAIVLVITFMICYILREILEPRLIGDKVGMSPIMSLVAIYAGYKLFGLIGAFLGPLVYIAIKEGIKM